MFWKILSPMSKFVAAAVMSTTPMVAAVAVAAMILLLVMLAPEQTPATLTTLVEPESATLWM